VRWPGPRRSWVATRSSSKKIVIVLAVAHPDDLLDELPGTE
jgi:hypothetical protein